MTQEWHYSGFKSEQMLRRFVHVESRISGLGWTLAKKAADPRGNYVPFTRSFHEKSAFSCNFFDVPDMSLYPTSLA
jgi:hypothetical protein